MFIAPNLKTCSQVLSVFRTPALLHFLGASMGCFQLLKLRRLFKAMVSSVDHVIKSIFGSMAGTHERVKFQFVKTCQKGLKENVFQQQFTKKSPTRKSPIFPPRDFHPNLDGFSSQRFVSEHLRVRYVEAPKV